MNVLIPVDNANIDECSLTLLDDRSKWLLLDISEGKIVKYDFFEKKEDIQEFIDVLIVQNQQEYVWPFVEENIPILIAHTQRSIEDIVEAYIFKELHEYRL